MVKVFMELSGFAATATREQLRDEVLELEDAGAAGVSFSDHIFVTQADRPRRQGVGHGADQPLDRCPYVLLGEPAQIAEALLERQQAYGLDRISRGESDGISSAPYDPIAFCRAVTPHLA